MVVIGGGINGVAVARECARAGKRTLLVEQNDLLRELPVDTDHPRRPRYLEHGELGLVRRCANGAPVGSDRTWYIPFTFCCC